MITTAAAQEIVKKNSQKTTYVIRKGLKDCITFTLAENIVSPIFMPPFRQSAMDGYALCLHKENTYTLIGEIQAGDAKEINLNKGQAVRIFTGAAVPDTANAVIQQEKVLAKGNSITVDSVIKEELNIRPKGEQINIGEVALQKGTVLTSAAIGYLTSLGITEVNVYQKPKIKIITTGDEIVSAGQELQHGQIYESNSIMLVTALQHLGYKDVEVLKVADDYQKTYDCLYNAIENSDLVLVTGGISVGDYDFVGKVLKEIGVEQLFYKVKQKPGKPLFFGKKEETLIFALPGNPAATLSCFYVYVRIALERMSGNLDYQLPKSHKTSLSNFNKKGDRAQFLKGFVNGNNVTILEGQSSAMLQTFALANALVIIPEDLMEIKKGDTIEIISIL